MEVTNSRVYKLVLTGGPCGGKTTGQARLCTFFENMGWKVYRVPETATILLGGGVKFTDLSETEVYNFQLNLIKTMMSVEDTFFQLAESSSYNCLVICDRGVMDASAYMKPEQWSQMKRQMDWNDIDLRDNRYDQVIHMVSAANGAESFYGTADHIVRHEDIGLARKLDDCSSQAWVGHPYFDVIDNSTDFEAKIVRMIASVCYRLGINAGDRLSVDSKKRKFLVSGLPPDMANIQFQDFIVVHDYLVTPTGKMQARIRKRGQNVHWDSEKQRWNLETDNRYHASIVYMTEDDMPNAQAFFYGTEIDFSKWTYTHTIRRVQAVERKMQISAKEYELLVAERDTSRYTVYKKRRCFLWNNHYFQMDIYQEPCHPRCKNLILLETYTTQKGEELSLPDFLNILKEVTNVPAYSMYNLSKKDDIKDKADLLLHQDVNSIIPMNGWLLSECEKPDL